MDFLHLAERIAERDEKRDVSAYDRDRAQMLALIAIGQELRRFNDRAGNEIDRQELLAESKAVRDLYQS